MEQLNELELPMSFRALHIVSLLALAPFSLPADADDCTSAMTATAQRPVSAVTTKIDAQGKQSTLGMVQTMTTQYIQTTDGQWHSVGVTVQDKIGAAADDLKTSKITCARTGIGLVNGVPATIYAVHRDSDGDVSDSKVWVASNFLIRRSEGSVEGVHYVTLYDYAHVSPPANAKPVGTR
jgi:hypothetical protein